MKWLLVACLSIGAAFGQSSWRWREDARRAHAEAMREARNARLEAVRSAHRFRNEMMREAARARVEARHMRDEARRSMRESVRHDRTWRF